MDQNKNLVKLENAPQNDVDRDLLVAYNAGEQLDAKVLKGLKRRKAIAPKTVKYYQIVKGPKFAPVRKKLVSDMTQEMLRDGSWKDVDFKKYNYRALGKEIRTGNLHPLLKVRH